MQLLAAALVSLIITFAPACGEDDGCPGIVCTSCSGSGDCNIQCGADEIQVCRAHPEGDTDSRERCTYCTKL